MFGNKKKLQQQLESEGGIVAWANVIDTGKGWATASTDGFGMVTSQTDHLSVSLRVEPDGAEPFEASFRQAFKGLRPMKGWQCKVVYDPADHSRIAIIEDSITPPGMDHDKAERAAQARREAMEAAEGGNIAEYVEKVKAQARSGELGGIAIVDGQVVSGGAAPKRDVVDQLTKLADLRDRGALTDAEFQVQKAKLLAES
jgi:hypothetical protein